MREAKQKDTQEVKEDYKKSSAKDSTRISAKYPAKDPTKESCSKQDELVEQLLQQPTPRRALAKAITLAESPRIKDQQRVSQMLKQLRKRKVRNKNNPSQCRRIAIVGAPGAGKSSLIAALCARFLQKSQQESQAEISQTQIKQDKAKQDKLEQAKAEQAKLAVLAIDPSAVGGGGAILADKTRMAGITDNPQIFVRPSPAVKGGALAKGLLESILIYESCAFTHILIETVGSGQAETAIADYVDCLILLVSTKSGDALQGMKRGILEIADFLIVSKADGAERAKARKTLGDYQQAASCFVAKEQDKRGGYRICSAQSEKDIEKLCSDIEQFFVKKTKQEIAQNRAKQRQRLFLQAWSECAIEYAMQHLLEKNLKKTLEKKGGKTDRAGSGKADGKKGAEDAQLALNKKIAEILNQIAKAELAKTEELNLMLPAESARNFFWGGNARKV